MDSLLHTGGTLLTILFIAAVLYSLLSSFRKKRKKAARQKDLETKQHVQVENLHQYDVQPQKGYYAYPIDASDALRRYPQQFTALSLVLANEQPYSVCLIGFAEFEKGQLKNTHYFYVRPPENDITNKKYPELTWDVLRKADEFGEYWEAGMKDYFVGRTLVAHNASFVMGCIAHALKIYGIDAPCLRFIDTMEVAKTLYHFPSNKLTAISEEMNIEMDEQNALSAAMAAGQFLIKAKQDYPLYLPNIHFAYGMRRRTNGSPPSSPPSNGKNARPKKSSPRTRPTWTSFRPCWIKNTSSTETRKGRITRQTPASISPNRCPDRRTRIYETYKKDETACSAVLIFLYAFIYGLIYISSGPSTRRPFSGRAGGILGAPAR